MASSQKVLIIGGGPGGYVAAIRSAQLGFETTVVEKDKLGGVCLNWGCIPTKSLLKSAEVYALAQKLGTYGVKAENISFDLKAMVERSRQIARTLENGVTHLLKKNKVRVIHGSATFLPSQKKHHQIQVQGEKSKDMLDANHVIIATGARPVRLPKIFPEHPHIWTSREAMTPETLPKSLIIVGSGAIGLEFASFYNALGTDVTIVEREAQFFPVGDVEISDTIFKDFTQKGITVYTEAQAQACKLKDNQCHLTLHHKKKELKLTAERILLAIGIQGNIEDLGLKEAGIHTKNGRILTTPTLETTQAGIFAIGDVREGPALAHKASHEGIMAAEIIAGYEHHGLSPLKIPGCVYSSPQIASLGLTEKQALEKGYQINVGRFPFQANGKALAIGSPQGFVKTIFDTQTGELLGAHMIGSDVTEMIQGFSIASTLEGTEEELLHTVFPHPTISESMHESVLNALGRSIHF
jgi:dihydrolipoamide dehydrogenase